MPTTETEPQIILQNGRPHAVILDIRKYQRLLELVEEKNDLSELRRIKKGKTSFRELKQYLRSRV